MITQPEFEARMQSVWGSQRMNRETLRATQWQWLKQIVSHAERSVPYYRSSFAAHGFRADTLAAPSDLARAPILRRKDLRQVPQEHFLSEGQKPEELLRSRSSGSSGTPVSVGQTPLERSIHLAVRSRVYAHMGLPGGLRMAYVGLDFRPEEKQGAPFAAGSGSLHVLECRRPVEEILSDLVQLKPEVLFGYPGVLTKIAQLLQHEAEPTLRPRFLFVGGEVLYPHDKQLLESVFRAKVASTYACTEAFWLGGECKVTGETHLADDSVFIEVVDEKGLPVPPGQKGEVLVTALHSFAQPLIRYAIGDVAVQGTSPTGQPLGCPCGAPYATLGRIYGRELDYLTRTDGTQLHGYQISLRVRDAAPWLERYQLIQETANHLRVILQAQVEPIAADLEKIRSIVQENLGSAARVDFEIVREIEREPSGKFRIVWNRTLPSGEIDHPSTAGAPGITGAG